jgi:hypothetical protein
MDYKEIIEKLKSENPEGADAILTHVAGYAKNEASLRVKLKEAEKYAPVAKTLAEHGFDVEADIGEQLQKFKGATETVNSDWQKKFSTIEKELAEERKARVEKEQRLIRKSTESAFLPHIGETFFSSKASLEYLLSKGAIGVDENDTPFVAIGEKKYGVKDGMPELVKAFPELEAKNTQKAGGGNTDQGGKREPDNDKLEFVRRAIRNPLI